MDARPSVNNVEGLRRWNKRACWSRLENLAKYEWQRKLEPIRRKYIFHIIILFIWKYYAKRFTLYSNMSQWRDMEKS